MKISVVVVTNRVSGMDGLFAGLSGQTFQDFDVAIVDELYGWREHTVPFAEACGFLRHCSHRYPSGNERHGNYMRSLNDGLAATRGERVLFISDFTVLHPQTLETHARFHDDHPDDVCISGIEYAELPKLHPGFPLRYGWYAMGHDVANPTPETYAPWLDDKRRHELYEEWRQNYEADLASGRLDPFMWSCFEKPIESFADVAGLRVFNHDRRDTSPFLNLKNDSIPRSLLDKIGGFDERADGCHGHQDSITWRQLAKAGAKLQVRAENPVRLLDPHSLMIVRRMTRPDDSNLKIYEAAQ